MEMVTKILEVLEINRLVFLQMGIVFLLTIITGKMLIQPILRTFKERENRTTVPMKKAEEMVEKTESLARNYEERLRAAQRDSLARKRGKIEEITRGEKRLIEESYNETEAKILELKEEIDEEKQKALELLRKQSKLIAGEIAEKILGRKVS